MKSHIIYRPAGAAAEYASWGCNLYGGCTHHCAYCYNKRGVFRHALGGDMPQLMVKAGGSLQKAYELFSTQLDRDLETIIRDGGIFFSFTTDPMLPETIDGTMICAEYALKNGVPIQLLTKATWWLDRSGVVETLYDYRNLVRVGFTLTGRDDMEPCAPPNEERIQAMQYLVDCHIPVFASLEPIIDFASSLKMILDIADFCKEMRIGIMSPYNPKQYSWSLCDRFMKKVDELASDKGISVYYKNSIRRFYKENAPQ